MALEKTFSTGQTAKILDVSPRTVQLWMDSGKLEGYRLPYRKIRRFARDVIMRFASQNGMAKFIQDELFVHLTIVGADDDLVRGLNEILPDLQDFAYHLPDSWFEFGRVEAKRPSDVMIVDLSLGRSESVHISTTIRRDQRYQKSLIIALVLEDEANPEHLKEYGFTDVFKKPFDVAILAERIAAHKEAMK